MYIPTVIIMILQYNFKKYYQVSISVLKINLCVLVCVYRRNSVAVKYRASYSMLRYFAAWVVRVVYQLGCLKLNKLVSGIFH